MTDYQSYFPNLELLCAIQSEKIFRNSSNNCLVLCEIVHSGNNAHQPQIEKCIDLHSQKIHIKPLKSCQLNPISFEFFYTY